MNYPQELRPDLRVRQIRANAAAGIHASVAGGSVAAAPHTEDRVVDRSTELGPTRTRPTSASS